MLASLYNHNYNKIRKIFLLELLLDIKHNANAFKTYSHLILETGNEVS